MKTSVPFLLLSFAVCVCAGCGSSDSEVSPDNGEKSANSGSDAGAVSSEANPKTVNAATTTTRRPNERWTDENGVEYLGNVPLDVFFDQPLEVASNTTPLGGGAAAVLPTDATQANVMTPQNPPMTSGESHPSTVEVVAAGAGTEDWAELLPAKDLLDEVNQIRNFLKSSLQSVGAYNNSMLSIPGKAASLAALAEVASKHPEEISWKDDAIYIRDLAKQMTASALQRGKKDQGRLLVLFENIADILNRSKPAGLAEPNADESFADVAEMRLLMMRMAEAERRMKKEAGNESAFVSKKEMVQHESAILASLTTIIAREEYGYGDDPEFLGYARKVLDACETIRDATDTGTFSAYDLALSNISTNCQECHSVYKNN